MSSNKFVQKAQKVAKENPELFQTLMEFEKTKKIRTKIKLNFTIDKTIASQFKKYCREHGYNMSAKVEQSMRKMMQG